MAATRLRWMCVLLGIALALVACSSGASSSTADLAAGAEEDGDAIAISDQSEGVDADLVLPSSWNAFRRWAEETTISIDGAELRSASAVVECFGEECSSPVDYHRGVELVIPVGVDLSFEHPDVVLRGSARRLSAALRFVGIDTDGSSTFRFDEPGLHHLAVEGEVRRGSGLIDRFHHFAWVQVAEVDAPCVGAVVPAGRITGVTDAFGCPSEEGELNFEALHPSYHCNPWDPRLRIDARPGVVFIRDSIGRRSAGSMVATGLHLPGGGVFLDGEDDILAVVGAEGGELWVPEEIEEACA